MRFMTADAMSPLKFLSFHLGFEQASLSCLVDDPYSGMRLASVGILYIKRVIDTLIKLEHLCVV